MQLLSLLELVAFTWLARAALGGQARYAGVRISLIAVHCFAVVSVGSLERIVSDPGILSGLFVLGLYLLRAVVEPIVHGVLVTALATILSGPVRVLDVLEDERADAVVHAKVVGDVLEVHELRDLVDYEAVLAEVDQVGARPLHEAQLGRGAARLTLVQLVVVFDLGDD